MRVTQSMLTRNLLSSLNSAKESLNTLNNSIASGKRLDRASDDPGQFIAASRFKQAIGRNTQYLRNIANGTMWTDATSDRLSDLYNKLSEIKDRAIQGSDDSLDSGMRAAMAEEVDGLLQEMISIANSRQMGSNIFGGTSTQTEPFQYDGTSVVYTGNDGAIKRKIDDNTSVTVNITGQELMDTQMFDSIIALKDALIADDPSAVASTIDLLDGASEQIMSLESRVGSLANQLDLTNQRIETANVNLASYLSQSEDVDMAEVITKYNAQQVAYQAALQTMSDVIQTNLMDFLK
ncbi:MAG: flagellar hook-associated protein 3 [FCB group bacterium]|nr:flagellar hook-associated protein 3 [FCB group bacterium]